MKKIAIKAIIFAAAASSAYSAGYMGVKAGGLITKDQVTVFGQEDLPGAGALSPLSSDKTLNNSRFLLGFLGGVQFNLKNKLSAFVEGDVEFSLSNENGEEIYANAASNTHNHESVFLDQRYSVGITPGVNYQVTDKVSALFGLRLSMTQFNVRAFDKDPKLRVPADNMSSIRKSVFGFEPMIGGSIKINDKMSSRLTVGYQMSTQTTAIDNYLNNAKHISIGATAGVKLKSTGVAVRAALIYNF